MKLNEKELINNLEDLNKHLGFRHSAVKSAIQVVKMWQKFVQACGGYVIMSSRCTQVKDLTDEIEEQFFPSVLKKIATVEIQGKNEEDLDNIIEQIRLLYGVKGVKSSVTR